MDPDSDMGALGVEASRYFHFFMDLCCQFDTLSPRKSVVGGESSATFKVIAKLSLKPHKSTLVTRSAEEQQHQQQRRQQQQQQQKATISIFWSPLGSTLMSERTCDVEFNRFQAEFAFNCATLLPRFFKEAVLLQDSVSGIQTREPQIKNATSHLCTPFLSSSPPLTRVPVTVESRPSPG
ncbi:hypothetical protein PoB_001128000 [Plakobranchus ocellatus]|uniref:Uncharacterized protein n=1 Tax=Plakobranchus ocellatus TaxID=259542 RepID=A0AAV3YQQ6_9GAST|nr:hypothetical protein PoB_001128000 [Plakobranchus ocellatus]